MTTFTIGIDPGLTGALAVLAPSGRLEAVHDLPITRDGKLAWVDGFELDALLAPYGGGFAVVERVSAMPKQGVASSFGFGVGFGSLLPMLQARCIPFTLLQASVWKRGMGLIGKPKRASLDKARNLYPAYREELKLAKHDGRAEAILIARWWWERHQSVQVAA